jgi:putative ABC transport system ATP-binding protein
MIRFKGLEKVYQSKSGDYYALKNIDFMIKPGEYVIIMGKSGSGKTTLLNVLTGVDKPTAGEVVVGNTSINKFDEGKMAEWRGNSIGIVFQFFQLIPTLSVVENILLPMDLVNKIPAKERKERAMMLLAKVGLKNQADKMPNALSGGEQQRVAIARALANDVSLIIADEPTGNLDTKNAEIIFELFLRLKQEGKTIVMVTHERETIKGATRKILLSDGKVVDDINLDVGGKAV